MHEHLVEGFRTTATPHEVGLTAKKTQLLLVDAHAVVHDQMAEEYESADEKERFSFFQLKFWLKFFILIIRSTLQFDIKITTAN